MTFFSQAWKIKEFIQNWSMLWKSNGMGVPATQSTETMQKEPAPVALVYDSIEILKFHEQFQNIPPPPTPHPHFLKT